MRRSLIGANRPVVRDRMRPRRPRLERLEDRQLLTTIVVDFAPGGTTLVDAINLANKTAGADVINFNISGSGVHTIAASDLPPITDPVTIDGSSQPGYQGSPLIELDGGGTGADGLQISASNTVINGLAIFNYTSDGIQISANDVTITGCAIGTNAAGANNVPNGGAGIALNGASGVVIGGSGDTQGNVISGNTGAGIMLDTGSSSNTILGNFLGTTADGTGGLPNGGAGIEIHGGSNQIGGTLDGEGNIISGNTGAGIIISGANARSNRILGNTIGLSSADNAAVANGMSGVDIQDASNNTIGGNVAGAGNLIGGNTINGIRLSGADNTLIQGNTIGTDPAGNLDLGNGDAGIFVADSDGTAIGGTISGAGNVIAHNGQTTPGAGVTIQSGVNIPILSNTIYGNGALGIDLGGDGITPNDAGDLDTGPNNLQNYPILSKVATAEGRTLVQGTLNSMPNRTYYIEFFNESALDPSGNGQGRTLIGSTLLTTDANGNALINVLLDAPTNIGDYITATATATNDVGATGETSEFSPGMQLVAAQIADLAITIKDAPDPDSLNNPLTYTITVTNIGPDTATNVQFSQVLPTGVIFNTASSTQGSVGTGGQGLTGSLGDIPSGDSVTITVNVTPTATGILQTTASVFSTEIDTNAENNTDTETSTVEVPADVQVTLHPDPSPGTVGHRLDFVADVTNNGPGSATNVQLKAPIPSNVTFLGAFAGQGTAQRVGNTVIVDLGTITAGATVAVRIALIPNTMGPIPESVTVTSGVLDTAPGNNHAGTTAQVVPAADLAVRAEASKPALASGQTGTYTITVTNNGPAPANTANLKVTPEPGLAFLDDGVTSTGDPVVLNPDGTVQTTFTTIASGQSVTLTLHGQPADDFSGHSGLSATVSSTETGDIKPENNTATVATLINSADVGISQTSSPNPILVDGTLTFRIVVTNHGPAIANGIQVFDTLPAGTDFLDLKTTGIVTQDPDNNRVIVRFDAIAGGATEVITLEVRPNRSGLVTNDASVGINGFDPNDDNNRTVLQVPVSAADLAVSLRSSVGSVLAGDTLTYTATIVNHGPTDITSVVSFLDVLPAGVVVQSLSTTRGTIDNYEGTVLAHLGPLAANQQAVVTIVVIPTTEGTITNTVRVGSPQFDDDVSNNQASNLVQVTNAPGEVDLSQSLFVVREDAGIATITLNRRHGTAGEVSVHYAVVDGSAVAGRNYEAVSGDVTFQDGETSKTFEIPILHDNVTTGPLGATIVLSNPTGGAVIGDQARATLGIINIDIDVTPPVLTDVSLLGPPDAIVGVALTFSEPLDPARVALPGNFTLLTPRGRVIPTAPPSYDFARNMVVLVPARALPAGGGFSYVVVHAQGPNSVSDLSGNLLDGDANGQAGGDFVASFARGNRLSYRDSDADLVSLSITNGGSLDLIRGADGASRVLRIEGPLSRRSTLTGGVVRSPRQGNGLANLGRIEGIHFGQIRSYLTTPPLYVDAQFQTIASQTLLRPIVPQGTVARQFAARRHRIG